MYKIKKINNTLILMKNKFVSPQMFMILKTPVFFSALECQTLFLLLFGKF